MFKHQEELQAEVGQLRRDLEGYKKAFEELQAEVGELRPDRDGYKKAFEELQAEVGGLRRDRDGYKSTYEKLEAEVGELRRDREGYKKAFEELQAEVGQLRPDRDGYKKAYEEAQVDVGRLRPDRGGYKSTYIAKLANAFGYSITRRSRLETLLRESWQLREEAGRAARLQRELDFRAAGQLDLARAIEADKPVAPAEQGLYTPVYNYVGLRTDPRILHNHDFMKDPRFIAAYQRAMTAAKSDQKLYWRVHVALWCASIALPLEGDFVECGVWRGLLASAIMNYYNWNNLNRRFWLFDTFRGIDESQISDEELSQGNVAHFRKEFEEDIYDDVVENFSEFKNVQIVRGSVPGTLRSAKIERVCYLSIDMNNAAPEIAAATYFWDRLVPGAPILLDDYGWAGFEAQKRAFDRWAAERHVSILALPTGQGLIIKPDSELRALPRAD